METYLVQVWVPGDGSTWETELHGIVRHVTTGVESRFRNDEEILALLRRAGQMRETNMMMTTEDVTAAATANRTPKPEAEQPRRRANGGRRTVGGLAVALIMGVGGTLLLWGSTFTTTMVCDQLVAQKIRFPAKGSEALKPAEYPGLQRYAGQLVDDGPKAKAYAEQFIGTHLRAIAGGKTYAEVRTASRANPSDPGPCRPVPGHVLG